MILLWGLPDEAPMAAVRRALKKLGCPFIMLDQRQTFATEMDLSVGAEVRGELRCANGLVDLANVTAAYFRPYDIASIDDFTQRKPQHRESEHAAKLADALWAWAEVTRARVVNRPGAMASNSSKPFQAALIRAAGFATPRTLLTNNANVARAFWHRHSAVIYKSISSQRSIVSRLSDTRAARWRDLSSCPVQFQEHVPGTDVRVHVVGTEIFACEIESDADDYRYAARQSASIEIRPCTLPEDCALRCRRLAAQLDLLVVGVDLRRTPRGKWVCFEVNPSPAFTYYEDGADQRIAKAIARLLAA